MDLFIINRYDETKSGENDKDREAKILNELQKKIELKKLKKKNTNDERETPDEPVKRKRRKLKDGEFTEPADEVIPRETEIKSDSEIEDPEASAECKDTADTLPFSILGEQKFEVLHSIDMILPHWLSHPELLSSDLSTPGSAVKQLPYLCDVLKCNLKSMNIKNLFPVQEKLMPWILKARTKISPFRARDVCCSASTGSGKTLSYAVPIVQYLVDHKMTYKVTALVMLPVFELAVQVATVFEKLCNNLKVRSVLLSKHRDFKTEQNLLLERMSNGQFDSKVDIIISTGGRLVEHLFYTEGFDLTSLKFLVIDEADHAMSQVHNDWYHHLIQHLGIANELHSNRLSYKDLLSLVKENGDYKIPQKLLFSATLSQDPEKISTFNLFQPKLFTSAESKEDLIKYQARKVEEQRGQFIGKYTTPAELSEFYCITEYKLKPLTLFGLIKKHNWKRFLCFTNTVEVSHRLTFVLQTLFGDELKIEELSSLLPLKIRQRVLQKFSNGHVNGLICSDALSRGIDIENIEVVVSYDLPKHLKIYIHRIGRTARAGKTGTSVTLIAPDQIKHFEKLITTANKKSVNEMKPEREIEEANALNFANSQNKLRKALELEAEEKERRNTKRAGTSLFDKLQKQVKPLFAKQQQHVPESWKTKGVNSDAKV